MITITGHMMVSLLG
jgi:hypothetical protein